MQITFKAEFQKVLPTEDGPWVIATTFYSPLVVETGTKSAFAFTISDPLAGELVRVLYSLPSLMFYDEILHRTRNGKIMYQLMRQLFVSFAYKISNKEQ